MAIVASQFTAATPSGIPKIVGQRVAVNPGITQSLVNEAVPVLKAWNIYSVKISSRVYSEVSIYFNSLLVGSVKTGPASENVTYDLNPAQPLSAGDSILVEFKSIAGSPASEVGCWVHYTEADA